MSCDRVRWPLVGSCVIGLTGGVLAAFDSFHLAMSGLVTLLFGPAAILADWIDVRLSRRGAFGAVGGMVAGMVVRGAAALGGGCAVFFGTSVFRERPLTFWLWVCGGYVVFLVAGVASQIDASRRPVG